MASIIYRLYLFFSAVTPALIYSLVAALLVFLLSLRVDASMQLNLVIFFTALGFSAGIRVLKDIWSQWPYAYHSNKFKVAEDEIPVLEARPLHPEILHRPYRTVVFFSALIALVVGTFSYFTMSYAAAGHAWLLWMTGSLLMPLCLAVTVLVVADNFFRAYSKYDGAAKTLSAKRYLTQFYLIPEVVSFLILNVAIIWPLHKVQFEAQDSAWVTMLVMSLISSAILLMNAKVTPINQMAGALFSNVWAIKNIDLSEVDLSSPKQYQVWRFSYKGWLAFLVLTLMVLATAFMSSGLTHWFLPFLICAECLWLAVYLYLRIRVLKSTLAKVAVFYRQHNSYYQAGQFSSERQLPAELAL